MKSNFSEIKKDDGLVEKKLSELREEYESVGMNEEQLDGLKQKIEEAGMDMKNGKNIFEGKLTRVALAAAALAAAFIILPNTSVYVANAMRQIPIIGQLVDVVTIRDYEYETDRNMADIDTPEIVFDGEAVDRIVGEKLKNTAGDINAEISEITKALEEEFRNNLREDGGYQDVIVKSEILSTTPEYFTLKLLCYQGAGSGYEWNYYYTIDLNTGERLKMKDIFAEGSDYIGRISENIKEQMRKQMAEDENVYYWIDEDDEEWNFKTITEETSFYINERGNIVIGFNEGDVAPMYMGVVEFEIPGEAVADIRK